MPKVKLSLEERKDIFLYTTTIENLFINEYLPAAPGDYVKVFLFGLMYAQFNQAMDSRRVARSLGLTEDETEEAWIYWESQGLVKLSSEVSEEGEFVRRIEFVRQIDLLYGKTSVSSGPAAAAAEAAETAEAAAVTDADVADGESYSVDDAEYEGLLANRLIDKRLRRIYRKYQEVTGRTISRRETEKIADAIKVYGIEPEIFDFSIDYCADLEKYSIDYIFKVALRWTEEGCRTVEEARMLLDKHSLRNSWYTQVFRALGFNRIPAPADREIMDRWFDEMKCSIGEVLDACNASGGMREPNLRYVNRVLENRILEKGGINTRLQKSGGDTEEKKMAPDDGGSPVSKKVLSDYYEYLRSEEEKSRAARIEEVRQKIPEMKNVFTKENEINRRMLSLRPGNESLDMRQILRLERHELELTKKALLEGNGFPADYLVRRYRCGICKDTGYTDEGMVCSCCRERAQEAFEWIGEKNSR